MRDPGSIPTGGNIDCLERIVKIWAYTTKWKQAERQTDRQTNRQTDRRSTIYRHNGPMRCGHHGAHWSWIREPSSGQWFFRTDKCVSTVGTCQHCSSLQTLPDLWKKTSENISFKSLKSFKLRISVIFPLSPLHMYKCKHLSNSCMSSRFKEQSPRRRVWLFQTKDEDGNQNWSPRWLFLFYHVNKWLSDRFPWATHLGWLTKIVEILVG